MRKHKKITEKYRKKIKAAMTVEASLVLPIFLILFMNLLSAMEVYRIHSNVAASLWEAGREAAKNMYLTETVGEMMHPSAGEEAGVSTETGGLQLSELLTSVSVHREIVENLEGYPIWEKIVAGKRAGFLVRSDVGRDGTVRIDCDYRIHPLFASFTPVSRGLENHYYGHAWIGYVHDGSAGEQDETYVYITETGKVYHRNRGCSYLNPSIRSVRGSELENLRNAGGAVYYACPLCGANGSAGNYLITDYGTNYHASVACSGLKRTIYEVKLSEVGDRAPCSKCGG